MAQSEFDLFYPYFKKRGGVGEKKCVQSPSSVLQPSPGEEETGTLLEKDSSQSNALDHFQSRDPISKYTMASV